MRRILPCSLALFAFHLFLLGSTASAQEKPLPGEEWQVRGILRALKKDEYPKVRHIALIELMNLTHAGTPRARVHPPLTPLSLEMAQQVKNELRTLMKEQDQENIELAGQLLCELAGPEDLSDLRALLHHPNARVSSSAAAALGQLGDNQDLAALRPLLDSTNTGLRGAAALALGRLSVKANAGNILSLLKDPKVEVRVAATTLVQAGDAQALEELRKLLDSPDITVRRDAASAVGRLGDKQAAEKLRAMVNDPVSGVRIEAAEALVDVTVRENVVDLAKLLAHPDSDVRRVAAEAAGQAAGPETAQGFRKLLDDPNPLVQQVGQLLTRSWAKEDIDSLLALDKNREFGIRSLAGQILVRLADQAAEQQIQPLFAIQDSEFRAAIAVRVGRRAEMTQVVRNLVHDPNRDVREAVAIALGTAGGEENKKLLEKMLSTRLTDEEDITPFAAADALTRAGGTSSLIPLSIPYEEGLLLPSARFWARYWGGARPQESEVLCAYLGRPQDDPNPPVTDRGATRREKALRDLRVLREEAWAKTDSRWVKEDVARWWIQIIAGVKDWGTEEEIAELKAIRGLLTDGDNKVGRGYIPAIEEVLAPFEIWPSPAVRTLLALLAVNASAFLLYRLSPTVGGLERWLPFVVPVAVGAGVGLTDLANWAHRLHTIPWLLAVLLAAEFLGLVGGGLVSPRLLRQIAPIKPFGFVVPLALRLPWGRRRYFADYVQRVRHQVERDRRQAADERYVLLPADVRNDRCPTPTLCADPAGAVLKILTSEEGPSSQVLIEATGGRGKSALVREIVARALEEFEKDPGRKPLPVRLSGTSDSIESLVREALGGALILQELLPQHLEAGDFFLVLDGVSESGLPPKVLGGFLNGPFASTTPMLLGSRPAYEFRQLIEGTARWTTVEPRRLDEVSLSLFVQTYGGKPLSPSVQSACRGSDGTYLPILVRMALRVGSQGGSVGVADIYRDYFLELFAAQFPDDRQRLGVLHDASRWCLETYWKDGRRNRNYEATELQQSLVRAGVLIARGGVTVAREVRFAHDSMQSYLTSAALAAEDEHGYATLPDPAEDGRHTTWDRPRVLARAAGSAHFTGAPSDILLAGGSELFQMLLTTFGDRESLRRCLRGQLDRWSATYHQNLRLMDFQTSLPQMVAEQAASFADNKVLLARAVEVAFDTDVQAGTVEMLGGLYGCLAPFVQKLGGEA